MGKKIMVSLVLITMAVSTPVFAQGWNYKAGNDCWSYNLGVGVCMTPSYEILPYGEISIIRGFRSSNWESGVTAYGLYDEGIIPGVDLTFGYKQSNEHAGVRLYALGGLGAANHKVTGENSSYVASIERKQLKPEVGIALSGYVNLGSLSLTAALRYAYQFNMKYGKTDLDGMTVTSESWTANRLAATIGLSYNICRSDVNYDGDRCMQAKMSVLLSEDALTTVGADWFFRTGSNWMMFFGAEVGMTITEHLSTAVIEFGTQYLIFDNKHADSWILPTIAFQAGLGEQSYRSSAINDTTINETPWNSGTFTTQQGLELGGYAGIHFLPLKAFRVKNTKGELEIGLGYKIRTTITSDPSFEGEAIGSFKKIDATKHGLTIMVAYTF